MRSFGDDLSKVSFLFWIAVAALSTTGEVAAQECTLQEKQACLDPNNAPTLNVYRYVMVFLVLQVGDLLLIILFP